jgi:2-(1,2-epoxy-1,2-dihydrophenyl)acetyl-CoA isomerase
MEKSIKLEQTNDIAIIRFNRPKLYNSFGLDMIRILAEWLVKLAVNSDIVGVVFSGEGKAFCAGGDLKWVASYGKKHGVAFHELAAYYHQAILEIRRMPKPVVAAINGLAAGGGFSLALACDFRIMEASATLMQAYTTNGLSIDGGGTFTLPRMVGLAKAIEIAAFDRSINAEKALSWGLVTEIANDGASVERAIQLIDEMKKRSFTSFAATKRLLTDSFNTTFEAQLEKERELLSLCADHPDGREGIAAFVEKRKPAFNRS